MKKDPKRLRVLTIDGGGMRGLYSATYLDLLARRYSIAQKVPELDIGAGFNLIAGTSTGAIVACALAVGEPLENVVRLYRERGEKIFPIKMPEGRCLRKFLQAACQLCSRPRHLKDGTAALTSALNVVLRDTTLGDVWKNRKIALAIPAVEVSSYHSWVFKTPHPRNPEPNRHDENYKLVDVCLATSAAPTFRSLALVRNPDPSPNARGYHVFADGGLWANNPVLVGLIDALRMTSPGDSIDIFCLGTCPRPGGEIIEQNEIHRHLLGWNFGAKPLALSLNAQEFAFDRMAQMIARHVNRKCRIVRFPHGDVSADMMKYLALDEVRSKAMDALQVQAQNDVDETLHLMNRVDHNEGQLLKSLFKDFPSKKDKTWRGQK